MADFLLPGPAQRAGPGPPALPPQDRLLGAEVNSIDSIIAQGSLEERTHLFLLVSDTEDGRATGELLKNYYQNERNPWRFAQVAWQVLTGLTGADPRFASLVEIIEEEGEKLVDFTAMGQLFHESFRFRFRQQRGWFLPARRRPGAGSKKDPS